jgi:hypothetical protein
VLRGDSDHRLHGRLTASTRSFTFCSMPTETFGYALAGGYAFWRDVPDGGGLGGPSLVGNAPIAVSSTPSRWSGPVVETSRCRGSKSDYGARAADRAASGSFSSPRKWCAALWIACAINAELSLSILGKCDNPPRLAPKPLPGLPVSERRLFRNEV